MTIGGVIFICDTWAATVCVRSKYFVNDLVTDEDIEALLEIVGLTATPEAEAGGAEAAMPADEALEALPLHAEPPPLTEEQQHILSQALGGLDA